MSILDSNIISTLNSRKTSLNLYDQENKSNLFQLKAYTSKSEINSSLDINISSKKLNIINLDGTEVYDVATVILDIITRINSLQDNIIEVSNAIAIIQQKFEVTFGS